jgi:hypothetical protein
MLLGIGWCVLRSSQSEYRGASIANIDIIDDSVDAADKRLWDEFRAWMANNAGHFLLWTLHEQHNNHRGILQFFVSRNHRSPELWSMIEWIVTHGPGSYGLVYVHNDEDEGWRGVRPARGRDQDFTNVFRAHRILNGRVEELPDPFFGEIVPNIDPPFDFE